MTSNNIGFCCPGPLFSSTVITPSLPNFCIRGLAILTADFFLAFAEMCRLGQLRRCRFAGAPAALIGFATTFNDVGPNRMSDCFRSHIGFSQRATNFHLPSLTDGLGQKRLRLVVPVTPLRR